MRMFVKYDKLGNITSFCKADAFPDIFETPFGRLEKGEFAVEVEPTPQLEKMECDEVHDEYIVDTQTKKLVKKQ